MFLTAFIFYGSSFLILSLAPLVAIFADQHGRGLPPTIFKTSQMGIRVDHTTRGYRTYCEKREDLAMEKP